MNVKHLSANVILHKLNFLFANCCAKKIIRGTVLKLNELHEITFLLELVNVGKSSDRIIKNKGCQTLPFINKTL